MYCFSIETFSVINLFYKNKSHRLSVFVVKMIYLFLVIKRVNSIKIQLFKKFNCKEKLKVLLNNYYLIIHTILINTIYVYV